MGKVRVPRRYVRYCAVFILSLVCFLLWTRSSSLISGVSGPRHSAFTKDFAALANRNEKLADLETQATVYDELFSHPRINEFLAETSFQDRCSIYFNQLTADDPDWSVQPSQGLEFAREAYEPLTEYMRREKEGLRAKEVEAKIRKKKFSGPTDGELRQKHNHMRQKLRHDEQIMHDYLAHVRVFKKCFLGSEQAGASKEDAAFAEKQSKTLGGSSGGAGAKFSDQFNKSPVTCSDVEQRVFPWLTLQYPIFRRWDGETVPFPGATEGANPKTGCFLSDYKAQLNGKGIVLTFSDLHTDTAIRFVRTLRYLGNKLPIQVVNLSELSAGNKELVVEAARDEYNGYVAQDLWFVDADPAVAYDYQIEFNGFANKLLATMFNSFAEMVLVDADTVLLKDPEYFFKLKKYTDTGTMFYKDRSMGIFRAPSDFTFFHKLMPSVADTTMFNVPQITDHTLNNGFFQGSTFYMESGVVVLNRKKHFSQALTMATLNSLDHMKQRVYGDKELYWLALVFEGDESYAFNKHYAAAAGELTPLHERQADVRTSRKFRSQEICSNHPAHISDLDNHDLVWFNSGFRHCSVALEGKIDWKFEANYQRRYSHLKTPDEFREFAKTKLKIRHAVIPPVRLHEDNTRNEENEPEKPWLSLRYCYGYSWCAYTSIGGKHDTSKGVVDTTKKGILIEFTPEEIRHIDAVGDIWMEPTGLF